MNRILKLCLALTALVALTGCDSRTDKAGTGGVTLSLSRFDGLPVSASVNGPGFVVIGEVDISNVPLNPGAGTSQLMDVEIVSYEVIFTRGDTGTRVPQPFVRGIFGVAPVGGILTIEDLPVLDQEQLGNPPLSDLLFENGGVDSETGADTILLNCRLRFFGRTLSGDEVQTGAGNFSVTFTR